MQKWENTTTDYSFYPESDATTQISSCNISLNFQVLGLNIYKAIYMGAHIF